MLGFKDEMVTFKNDMLGFKDEMVTFKDDMLNYKNEMVGFKDDMLSFKKSTEGSLDRIEFRLENIEDKLSEAFEALEAHAEINERQHKEMMNELKGELNIVELAVKRVAK